MSAAVDTADGNLRGRAIRDETFWRISVASISASTEMQPTLRMSFKHPETPTEQVAFKQPNRRIFHLRHFWHCECNKAFKAMEELNQPSMPREQTMHSELVFAR
jgi:hypothetical protein